jgi:hypothetical protein
VGELPLTDYLCQKLQTRWKEEIDLVVAENDAQAMQEIAYAEVFFGWMTPALLQNANAWLSSGFELASIGGPALGGFLIAIFHGATWVYWFAAAAQSELLEQRLWAARSLQRTEVAQALAEQLLRDFPQSPEAQRVLQQQGLLRRLLHQLDHPAAQMPLVMRQNRRIEGRDVGSDIGGAVIGPGARHLGEIGLDVELHAAASSFLDIKRAERRSIFYPAFRPPARQNRK